QRRHARADSRHDRAVRRLSRRHGRVGVAGEACARVTAPPPQAGAEYRPDIDGLRATAVLAIILFHAGFTWIPGGYLVVDVFFVISGFLITGILLRENASRTFTLRRFYERRARRILPALLATLAVVAVFAYVLMLPMEFRAFAQSLVGVLFFSS